MTDDQNAAFLILFAEETAALARLLDLEERHERRLGARVAGRTDQVVAWSESPDEEDDEDALQALRRFSPTAWWRWTPEEWDAAPPPEEAV